jgi:hypothetical protein
MVKLWLRGLQNPAPTCWPRGLAIIEEIFSEGAAVDDQRSNKCIALFQEGTLKIEGKAEGTSFVPQILAELSSQNSIIHLD